MRSLPLPAADIMDDIKAANDKFMAAFDSGDATGLSQLYTEDCKLMPPGSDVVMGREGKVGRGNLERGVTWNETLSWASCTKMGAVRQTL